ncbi:MAG: vanadium-dependent haloperoxidase [Verrucomicrobiales bacterium]|nr:vanadium-dependent haloperoxidase [Verrucomicrobiales bacterium]
MSRKLGFRVLLAAVLWAANHVSAAPPIPEPNVVVGWNVVALRAIEQGPPEPTITAWRLHVLSAAMYDAWAVYDSAAMGYRQGSRLRRPSAEQTPESKRRAVSYAAHRALVAMFPFRRQIFDARLEALGLPPSFSTNATSPEGLGNLCADAVLEFRRQDGSNAEQGFAEITSDRYPTLYRPRDAGDTLAPNHWQPLRVPNGRMLDSQRHWIHEDNRPLTYSVQRFLTPHWGAVVPFALTTPDQFRPPHPPRKGHSEPYLDALGKPTTEDQAWNDQVDELVAISEHLSDEQKVIAEYWADGPHHWTPPGHWNRLAQGIARRDRQTIDESARMFFALNGALLDASIACWETKRAYDYVRPQSAIRHKYSGRQIKAWAGPDRGVGMIDGGEWRPYQAEGLVTPPFPEYCSGHSTFSRAAREVLLGFTGTDRYYDGQTRLGGDWDLDGEEDWLGQHRVLPGKNRIERSPATTITLRWATLLEAADQAGLSRRFGGIHFQDGDLFGRKVGEKIGQQALLVARRLWEGASNRRSGARAALPHESHPAPEAAEAVTSSSTWVDARKVAAN